MLKAIENMEKRVNEVDSSVVAVQDNGEILKEDSILWKKKEIKRISYKLRKLIVDCEKLKYNWDIRLNEISQLKVPFVFSNIDIDEFTNTYYKAMVELYNVISTGVRLYELSDISSDDKFVSLLQECLSNCCVLNNEYNELLNNVGDHTDAGYNKAINPQESEVYRVIENIFKTLADSSWIELSCLSTIKIDDRDTDYTPVIPSWGKVMR